MKTSIVVVVGGVGLALSQIAIVGAAAGRPMLNSAAIAPRELFATAGGQASMLGDALRRQRTEIRSIDEDAVWQSLIVWAPMHPSIGQCWLSFLEGKSRLPWSRPTASLATSWWDPGAGTMTSNSDTN